jgi:hypothetical protein
MSQLHWLVLALVVLGTGYVALSAWGAHRWSATTRGLGRRLTAARAPRRADTRGASGGPAYDPRDIKGLPAPVQRYFRTVLRVGQPMVAAVTLDMTGRFNLSATAERWCAFTARQWVCTRRPGFLWDAQMRLLPGLPVMVVDSFIAGQGWLRAAVMGLFTVADQRGSGRIAGDEFMRYFAETAWYPTALLPSQGVRWEAVDATSARASINDGPLTLSLLFAFNAEGLIESASAEARGAAVAGAVVMRPWEGRWSNYQRCHGMLLPLSGEAAWLGPQGRRPYFVGHVTSLSCEFER